MTDRDRERIASALAEPSYTPARRDLPAVAAIIAGDDEKRAAQAVKAILRADGRDAGAALRAAAATVDEAGAARLVTAAGQVARSREPARAELAAWLIGLLDAGAPRPRRAAVLALGKLGGDDARVALCAYADRPDLPPDHRRAVVEALGKVGGAEAEARLAAATDDGDAELRRRRDRALLMTERDRARDAPSRVRGDVPLPENATVAVRCRGGLEGILSDELGVPVIARGLVHVYGATSLASFHRARTWLSIGVERALPEGGELPARIAGALVEAEPLLASLTEGAIRWRLDFDKGGHRRAVVWETARRVRDAAPALINDPTATTWDVIVTEAEDAIELRPRRLEDPRFAWRVADVSAASHPTIAAAIAREAGARPGDVVWDPFCGSGAELIERALLGPAARFIGGDLDARALDAARRNAAAAGVDLELVLADALDHDPGPVDLIVTNPPLGRRIRGDVGGLLERFLARAARLLRPGGRVVWVTPVPERTERAGRRAGLTLDDRRLVDLGGYDAGLERWTK